MDNQVTPHIDENGTTVDLFEKNKHLKQTIKEHEIRHPDYNLVIRHLKAIAEASRVIIHATEEIKMLQDICRTIVETGGYRFAWIGFAEQDKYKTVKPIAHKGFEDGYLDTVNITWDDSDRGRGPTGKAIRTRKTVIAQNILENEEYEPWRNNAILRGYSASISIPFTISMKCIGTLNVYAVCPMAFNEAEVELIEGLTKDLEFGISVLRTRIEKKQAEDRLRESESKYSSYMENAPDGVFVADERGRYLEVNKNACLMTGYSEEELLQMSISDLLAEEHVEIGLGNFRRLSETGMSKGEIKFKHKDGSVRWWFIDAVKISDKCFLGFTKDITERKGIETKLLESESKYRNLFNQATDGIMMMPVDGNSFIVNKSFANLHGYNSPQEMEHLTLSDLDTPETATLAPDRINRILAGESMTFEVEHYKKDGQRILLEVTCSLARIEGKSYMLGFHKDITERKKAEMTLVNSENRFRKLIQNSSDILVVLDEEGIERYLSDSVERITGFTKEECIGVKCFEFLHPDDVDVVMEKFMHVVANPGITDRVEYRHRHKNGGWVHLEAIGTNLLFDEAVRGIVLNVRDNTERKKAEDNIRNADERMRRLVKNSSDIIVILNTDGTQRYVSPAAEKITGFQPEELTGKSLEEIIHPDDMPTVLDVWNKAIVNPEHVLKVEYRHIHKSGGWVHLEAVGQNFFNDPVVNGAITSVRDITKRKHDDEAIRLSESRFRSVFHTAPVGICIVKDRVFQSVNKAMCEKFGYLEADLVGHSTRILYENDDDYERVDRELYKFLDERGRNSIQIKLKRKDGSSRNTIITASYIYLKDVNLGIVIAVEDITERKIAEEKLQESEERFRRLANSTWEGIVIHKEGVIIDVNNSFLNMVGYHVDEIIGKSVIEFLSPESREPALQRLREGSTHDQLYLEVKVVRKDKTVLFAEVLGRPLRYGNLDARVIAVRDITIRKRASEALQESETKYREITEKINDILWTMDDNFKLTYLSPSVEKVLGFEPGFHMNRDLNEQLTPMSMKVVAETMDRELALESGSKADPHRTLQLELEYYHQDGTTRWIEQVIGGLRDKQGKLIGIHGVGRDITERKLAEEKLMAEKAWSDAIISAAPNIVVGLGERSKILLFNKYAEELTGYKSDEVIGEEWIEIFIPAGMRKEIYDVWDEIVTNNLITHHFENHIITKKGEQLLISWNNTVLKEDGKFRMVLSIGEDITKRKQFEKALQESEEKFRTVADWTYNWEYWASPEGLIIYTSPSVKRITGYSDEEMISNPGLLNSIVHPLDSELWESHLKDYLYDQDKQEKDLEFRIINRNGKLFWLHHICRPVFGKNGRYLGRRVSNRDITIHKRLEGIPNVRLKILLKVESKSLDETIGYILGEIEALTESSIGFYHFIEGDQETLQLQNWSTNTLKIMCSAEGKGSHYRIEQAGVWVDCVHERRPVIHNDYESLAHRKGLPLGHAPVKRELVVPIIRGGSIMAIIGVGNKPTDYDETDIEIVQSLAEFSWEIVERKRASTALKLSEEKYKNIFDNAIEGIYQTTPEGRYRTVNPSFAAMFGYDSPEEMITAVTNIGEQLYADPSDRDKLISLMIKSEGKVRDFEVQLLRKDRSSFWVSISAHLLTDEKDGRSFIEGTCMDITERKHAEGALKESEKKYRQLVETLQEGIWLIDKDSITSFVNPRMAEILGYTVEEMIGKPIFSFMDERSAQIAKLGIDGGKQNITKSIDFEFIRKDGVRVYSTLRAIPITDEKGNYIGSLAGINDVTERKLAEDAVRESQRRMKDIIEFLPDATLVIDKEGRVIAWNRAIEFLTGVKAEAIIGKGNYEYALPFHGERKPILIDLALHPELIKEDLYTVFHREGDIVFGEAYTPTLPPGNVHLSATASVLRNSSGEVVGAIECIRNNTERKVMEERLQRAEKMEALGLLAGGVAHDLNNALGILVGYSELLYDGLEEANPLREDARNILQGGEQAAAIVQDLLTLARRGVQTRTIVNLNKTVAEYLKSPEQEKLSSFHPTVRIKAETEDGILQIDGSPVHLAKTLVNLVSNAAEAMPSGGDVTIRTENRYMDTPVSGYDTVQEGDYVVLSVSDEGEGINEVDMKRIFEPFYTKKVMGRSGTGLGLAVVWGTVKDHKGYIDVHSKIGKGTTFSLYFPVTRKELAENKAITPDEYEGRGERILVVDDIQNQRELASRILARLNYNVATAASGEDAIKYMKDNKTDLVVLDMIMEPGIDGFETYKRISELQSGQRAIIVSGFAETDRVRMAQSLGAGAFVRKPYIRERLGLAVRQELDRK